NPLVPLHIFLTNKQICIILNKNSTMKYLKRKLKSIVLYFRIHNIGKAKNKLSKPVSFMLKNLEEQQEKTYPGTIERIVKSLHEAVSLLHSFNITLEAMERKIDLKRVLVHFPATKILFDFIKEYKKGEHSINRCPPHLKHLSIDHVYITAQLRVGAGEESAPISILAEKISLGKASQGLVYQAVLNEINKINTFLYQPSDQGTLLQVIKKELSLQNQTSYRKTKTQKTV
ncbi:MAG TPA: hypothetical protein VLB02_01030, partial [Candidatus Paceibacterota bacterium]|nr:hypothetical protein [Candidatus Paceibacterota bacterium]